MWKEGWLESAIRVQCMKILIITKNLSHLELLFLTVFALPNASRTGLDCKKSQIKSKEFYAKRPTYTAV